MPSPEKLTVLAAGAHADDLELGAGGLVARLANSDRIDLWILILTDTELEPSRRVEAIEAARALGIDQEHVLFAGFPDGALRCEKATITSVRTILSCYSIVPQLVISHSRSDSHNDHRAAHDLMLSAVRATTFVHFSVPLSQTSDFTPRLFADTTDYTEMRQHALSQHASQIDRIRQSEAWRFQHRSDRVLEPFEVTIQQGSFGSNKILGLIDDRPFRRLWSGVASVGPMSLIYGMQAMESRAYTRFDKDHERQGIHELHAVLEETFGRSEIPFNEISAIDERAIDAMFEGSVLLVGGPVSNRVVRDYYSRFPSVSMSIDFDMPGYVNRRIQKRDQEEPHLRAVIRNGELVQDACLISCLPNPCCAGSFIVGAMGAHGPGTRKALRVLNEPSDFIADSILSAIESSSVFEQTLGVAVDELRS